MFLLQLQSSCCSPCLWQRVSGWARPVLFSTAFSGWVSLHKPTTFGVIAHNSCGSQHDRGHELVFSRSPGSSIPVELVGNAGVQAGEGGV